MKIPHSWLPLHLGNFGHQLCLPRDLQSKYSSILMVLGTKPLLLGREVLSHLAPGHGMLWVCWGRWVTQSSLLFLNVAFLSFSHRTPTFIFLIAWMPCKLKIEGSMRTMPTSIQSCYFQLDVSPVKNNYNWGPNAYFLLKIPPSFKVSLF